MKKVLGILSSTVLIFGIGAQEAQPRTTWLCAPAEDEANTWIEHTDQTWIGFRVGPPDGKHEEFGTDPCDEAHVPIEPE